MSKPLFTHPISLSLSLSAIAFLCPLTPALFNRQTPTATSQDVTPPDSACAIAINPATQAITLEATDNR